MFLLFAVHETGYTGKNCLSEADPCNPSQCLNGGTCVANSTHFRYVFNYFYPIKRNLFYFNMKTTQLRFANSTFPFRCECPTGFAGPLCQHNLNECESSPCIHGICVDQEDGFRCFCQPGEFCKIQNNFYEIVKIVHLYHKCLAIKIITT